MYDELVKRLRQLAEEQMFDFERKPYLQAADAIEELSAFREQVTDGHFYCMRGGVLYEAKVEPPKGKVFQLPPIEFAGEGRA